MKRGFFLKLVALGTVLTVSFLSAWDQILISYSTTPPPGLTGAPGEGTCSNCHIGGTLQPSDTVTITFYDTVPDPDTIVQYFEPGKTYRVVFSAFSSWAGRFGFELTALDTLGNIAGSFALINPSNTAIQTYNNRYYVSHKNASSNNTWEFLWTAPIFPAADVTFYFVTNFANNNGASSGDAIYVGSAVFPIIRDPDVILFAETLKTCVGRLTSPFVLVQALNANFSYIKLRFHEIVNDSVTLDSTIVINGIPAGFITPIMLRTIVMDTNNILYKVWVDSTDISQLNHNDTVYTLLTPIFTPIISQITGPDSIPIGDSATFLINVSGEYDSIIWYFQGIDTPVRYGQGPHLVYWDTLGTYDVRVSIFSQCKDTTITRSVLVYDTAQNQPVLATMPLIENSHFICIFTIEGKLIRCLREESEKEWIKLLGNGAYIIRKSDGSIVRILVEP